MTADAHCCRFDPVRDATKSGLTPVSGNVSDADLLLRVGSEANVLLYGV